MLHVTLTLTPELERQLAEVAARIGEAPDEIARKALLAYLGELEDCARAAEAWKARDPAATLSTEEMLRALDLGD